MTDKRSGGICNLFWGFGFGRMDKNWAGFGSVRWVFVAETRVLQNLLQLPVQQAAVSLTRSLTHTSTTALTCPHASAQLTHLDTLISRVHVAVHWIFIFARSIYYQLQVFYSCSTWR